MPNAKNLPYPPHWINAYIFAKLAEYDDIGVSANQQIMPIFATTPTNIEDIYKNVMQYTNIQNPLVIQYDRLIRFRPSAFYPHKREQVLYYLYSTSLENVTNANIVISQLLDRQDAAAQDLNAWAVENAESLDVPHNVFFHNFRVYQAEETRDIIELASARTIFINKLIVEYDYHANWDKSEDNQEQYK